MSGRTVNFKLIVYAHAEELLKCTETLNDFDHLNEYLCNVFCVLLLTNNSIFSQMGSNHTKIFYRRNSQANVIGTIVESYNLQNNNHKYSRLPKHNLFVVFTV